MPVRSRSARPVDERERDVDQAAVVDLGRLLRLQRLEARHLRVADAAAVAEAVDDLLLELAEQRDVLGEGGEVVRACRCGSGTRRAQAAACRCRPRGRARRSPPTVIPASHSRT